MSGAEDQPTKTTANRDSGQAQSESDASGEPSGARAPGLPEQLAAAFREQVRRALGVELDELGPTALAYVDYYLASLRDETREPILSLVSANAGGWFGELVRREIGGTWIGDGDPRRLRLLLEPQFVHFSPIDMAFEAILFHALPTRRADLSTSPESGDPRLPEGAILDAIYHLRKLPIAPFEHELADHDWVLERLAEVPPVPEDQYFSLTGRFETLQLILELLAGRELARGREPTRYHLNDYIAALTDSR